MSRCLHCDKEEANYCETCYQALISENAKLQKENEILKCSIKKIAEMHPNAKAISENYLKTGTSEIARKGDKLVDIDENKD